MHVFCDIVWLYLMSIIHCTLRVLLIVILEMLGGIPRGIAHADTHHRNCMHTERSTQSQEENSELHNSSHHC